MVPGYVIRCGNSTRGGRLSVDHEQSVSLSIPHSMPANRVSRLKNTGCSVPEHHVDASKLLNFDESAQHFWRLGSSVDVESRQSPKRGSTREIRD